MSIPGFATVAASKQFADKFRTQYAEGAYRRFGKTGLTVSAVGFGTYRCHQESDVHQSALKKALEKGCNLIDTSANYTDGNAEALIGDVMNQEIVWGDLLRREDVVIVSKAGYIQGENMGIALEKEKKDMAFPEVVKYQDGLWHCIHPKFIEDQVTRSLTRMHLDTLDVYLLHNPEYFLTAGLKRGDGNKGALQKEFYDRIRRAFIQMERLVKEGLIRNYGISSNSFPLADHAGEFVSLARVWKAYKDACLQLGMSAAEGHFSVIQLPFNWLETNAALQKNNTFQDQKMTVLALAKKLNLGVLINRPLNAIRDHHLLRLARYGFSEDFDYRSVFDTEVQKLYQMERALIEMIQSGNMDILVQKTPLSNLFQSSVKLQQFSLQSMDVSRFKEVVQHYFTPALDYASTLLFNQIPTEEKESVAQRLNDYKSQYEKTVNAWQNYLDSQNFKQVRYLAARFNHHHPDLDAALTFSQKAVLTAMHTKNVDVALVGMRTPGYVIDTMEALEVEKQILADQLL